MNAIGWGEIAGITAAIAAAVSSLQVRALGASFSVYFINMMRCGVAFIGFALIWWFGSRDFGNWQYAVPFIAIGVVFGLVIGDTLYFSAITRIGPGRATPIAMSYPLPTVILASILFKEQLSWLQLLGIVIGVAAIWVIAARHHDPDELPDESRQYLIGVAFAVIASVFWAIGILVLRPVLAAVPIDFANLVRVGFAASMISLFGIPAMRRTNIKIGRLRVILLILGLGLTVVVNSYCLTTSIHRSGAAVASILSSMAPVFAAPLGWLVLREPVTPRMMIAIALGITGILLVVAN